MAYMDEIEVGDRVWVMGNAPDEQGTVEALEPDETHGHYSTVCVRMDSDKLIKVHPSFVMLQVGEES